MRTWRFSPAIARHCMLRRTRESGMRSDWKYECITISQSAAGRYSTAAVVRVKLIISKRRRQAMAPLHILGALAFALMAAFPVASALAAGGSKGASAGDATGGSQRMDTGSALVQLGGEPLATDAKTKPPRGKKIDFDSSTVKSARAQLSALRNDFKTWLRANAPRAQVTGEFDLALNAVAVQLNGEALSTLAAAPMVRRVEYQALYYPMIADPDLSIIGAMDAWNRAGGAASAGEGVKVAVVDSGIDVAHLCFNDTGYGAQTRFGDPRFTNNKVIAARVFNNKTPSRGFTAEAIDSHGTHVAGTIGCNHDTQATVSGVTIPHGISGVAPRALLGNYNVFPADVANARSENILNALESAYADGFDVANMSLGGGEAVSVGRLEGIHDILGTGIRHI